MGWRIEAGALTELLLRLHADYPGLPLIITENGAAFADVVADDGSIHDQDRIDYLSGHLDAVAKAIAAGVDVGGYFLWSLMDNFEWAWATRSDSASSTWISTPWPARRRTRHSGTATSSPPTALDRHSR